MAECNHCGGFVTDDYARVFGDNENRVEDCRNCPTVRPTTDESDDGREVLLRDVRETPGRERDETAAPSGAPATSDGGDGETAVGADEMEGYATDPRAEDGGTDDGKPALGAEAGSTDDGEEDDPGGRIQSSLSAIVSALRS